MSDIKFYCPECGQKISCDSGYCGQRVNCPACQKPVTVPATSEAAPRISPDAPAPIRSSARAQTQSLPARSPSKTETTSPSSPAPAANLNPIGKWGTALAVGFPYLAIVSLLFSVWVAVGSIPRILLIWTALCFLPVIVCAHLIQAHLRSDPKRKRDSKLKPERIGKLGLMITCSGLCLLLIASGGFALNQRYFRPRIVVRESQAELDALKPRIVDEVLTGVSYSEREHGIDGKSIMAGPFSGKTWRSAVVGGYMSYTMKVLPDQPMSLNCRYWGSEMAGRTFDISIDDQVIATQNLEFNVPGHFFDVEYKIPARLTRGKTQVKVKFQAHPNLAAGGLFGCQTLKR